MLLRDLRGLWESPGLLSVELGSGLTVSVMILEFVAEARVMLDSAIFAMGLDSVCAGSRFGVSLDATIMPDSAIGLRSAPMAAINTLFFLV